MTNIEKSQTFNVTADRCFEGLLRALKGLRIEIHSSNAVERTTIARWSGAMGAKYTIQAQCVPEGSNTTIVHIVYRRDLSPILVRPPKVKIPPAEYTHKVDLILSTLTKYLDPSTDTSSIVAGIERDFADKKRATAKRLVVIALLSIITGAIYGFSKGGFSIHGFNTFFVATLIAWVVYALIARAMNK